MSLTLCSCLNSAGQRYPWLLFVQYTHRELRLAIRILNTALLSCFLSCPSYFRSLVFLLSEESVSDSCWKRSLSATIRPVLLCFSTTFRTKIQPPRCNPSTSRFGRSWLVPWPFVQSRISQSTTLTHGSYTPLLLPGLMRTLVASLLVCWPVLIYRSRRVLPHSTDLILPRAIPEI